MSKSYCSHWHQQQQNYQYLLGAISRHRSGTYVSVYIEFILNNRLRLRTFLRIDYQGTSHVPAIAYQENVSV